MWVNLIVQSCFLPLASSRGSPASVDECEWMVNDRPRHCQSISRVVWPLAFTLWGIRYVSSSHEASHHDAASILPLLCQVPHRPTLLLCANLSTLFIPSGLSLVWTYPLFPSLLFSSPHLYSPVCLSAQLSSSTSADSFHLSLFLWICCSAVPHSFALYTHPRLTVPFPHHLHSPLLCSFPFSRS